MEKLEKFLDKFWLLAIFLLSLPAVWALLVPGFYGASDDLHIAWLYEFHKTLLIGQIPPRFVPDLSFGFGYPLFNFVFPLPFYIGEVFHLIGLSFVNSIKAVFFVSIPLSGLFMYLLLRQFVKNSLSLIGAVLYIYTPYRAVDLYIRGAIGEIVSFVFLPLIILSIVKINQDRNLKWVGIGGFSLASLVLSHNITAYMFFPFIVFFFILQFFISAQKRDFLVKSLLTVFLGILISLYFWLPSIKESSLMKYDTVFNFYDHFPEVRQLITPYWGYGASVPGEGDGMSFFLGGVNIFILVIGSAFFLINRKKFKLEQKLLIIWAIAGIFIAIFLMNHRSAIVWNSLPLLPYFQFPWRFLILTTFFTPLLTVIFDEIEFSKFKPLLTVLLLALIILPVFSYFRPQHFLGREDNYYINRYIPTPVASREYLTTAEEYLRLPKETQVRPDKNFPLVFPSDGIQRIDKINDLNLAFDIELNEDSLINLNKYNFPGWKAKINGQEIQIKSGVPYGQVSILVPAGVNRVGVSFSETTFRQILNFVSSGAFLVSLAVILTL